MVGGEAAGRGGALRGVVVPLCVAGLVAIATLPLGRIYHGNLLTWLVLGAAVGPVLLSTALQRLPAYPVAPVSVLALGGYSLLAVRLSAHAGQVDGPLPTLWADAVRNGIPRLLTALIPVEPQPDTVLVPVVATWLAALAAAELAVRGRRVLLGYAPPTLLYAGNLVVVGPNARQLAWQPLAYATVAALGLAATGRSGTESLPHLSRAARLAFRVRLAVGGAAGLAVVLGLAVAVGPALAGRVHQVPTDPRRYVAPPSLDAADENPLIRLSGWALNPTQKLFDTNITGSAPATDLRIRLAVLSDYDGVNWRVGGDYREAGRVLPPVNGPGAVLPTGAPIRQTITIDDLDGKLLPVAPTAQQVDGIRVAYDQATGTVIRPGGLQPGVSYTVRSRQTTSNVNLLAAADVPSGPKVARFLGLGTPAPAMTELAQRLGGDIGAAYQKAQAVEDYLATHYTLVNDAPSGHAYPNLTFFLFSPTNLGGQKGTSEQFAASFAVLARMLGLPSRVIVGFQARPGNSTVRGKDALAWPEILFDGVGWVPFDPLPKSNATPQPLESLRPKPPPSTPPPSVAPTLSISTSPFRPSPSPSAVPVAAGPGLPPWVGAVAGGGLLVLLAGALAVGVLLRGAQRRRRLDQGSPAHRVAGAWREVLDALRLAGRPAARHLPATDVASYANRVGVPAHERRRGSVRPSTPPLDELAMLVNQATYATVAPDEEAARRAKAQALAYVAEVRARRPWWRRLLWRADPRPLRWR
jgi:transglutaminase-like putative cysteine protease